VDTEAFGIRFIIVVTAVENVPSLPLTQRLAGLHQKCRLSLSDRANSCVNDQRLVDFSHLGGWGTHPVFKPPFDQCEKGYRHMIPRNFDGYLTVGPLEGSAGILEDRCYILDHRFANARHTLTLEQDSEEINLLLDIFKDEFALRFEPGSIGLLCQRLNVTQQLPHTFIQYFHQQLVKALVVPEKGDVRYRGAVSEFFDGDGGVVLF
jgi:hypothetical protein